MGKISLKDKFAIDSQRDTSEQRHVIHLFREGKFFRAFNRSAWLISQYVYNEEYRKKIGASPSTPRATCLVHHGVPITTVQHILGHTKISTTQLYSEIMTDTITSDLKRCNFSK